MIFEKHLSKTAEAWRSPPEASAGVPTRVLVPWIAAAILIYLVAAVLVAPSGEPEKYFIEEPGLVNALSSVLLALSAGFFVVLYSGQPAGRIRLFSGLLAAGFFFFALDELVQGHEKGGAKLDSMLGDVGGFRNMGDVIVIAYGLVALAILAYFLPEFVMNREFAILATIGFVLYATQTGIDSLATVRTSTSAIIEESAKLFSSAFFATAAYRASMGVVRRDHAEI